ncbi:MAG TPA: NPCBM/NEW2 domain-containing protein, partial [Planctomycetota bacterium]|nr:NPCBM/NEW2 domain-containing protein [Planctomycetota bacterium]
IKFQMPPVPVTWDEQGRVYPFVPTYPLGLHFFVDARTADAPSGNVFIDDVSIATHLPPPARVGMSLERLNESNVTPTGRQILTVASYETQNSRRAAVTCGIFDWRGSKVSGDETSVELKPGEKRQIVISEKLPPGAYSVRAQLTQDGQVLASLEEDLLVADLQAHLGAEWLTGLSDEWKLRKPLRDTFTYIDEDWDWVEHYPGNFQMDTIRERCRNARTQGGTPFVLLGYGAYWSAGVGFEQMKAGAFSRRQRDIGHAVDIFMVPARMEDWENYVSEAMRGAGKDVGGWILWDNPDSDGPMKVDPPRFAQMIQAVDTWRREYCPQIPLLIGGMNRATAIPYLSKLREQAVGSDTALDHINGVQVRLDVGRLSPEDAEIKAYARELREALKTSGPEKTILLSDLDWAVEKESAGLSAFDQAAYLSRAAFLLESDGIRPLLSIRNEDSVRLGLGLVHRRRISVPPMTEKVQAHDLKPAWWAMVQTRRWLDDMRFISAIEVQDAIPGRTQCLLFQNKNEKAVAVIWRNDDPGGISFEHTGITVESAQDVLATPAAPSQSWYAIGKMPLIFVLNAPGEKAQSELGRLCVRDLAAPAWSQRVLAAFNPLKDSPVSYSHTGQEFKQAARTISGDATEVSGVRFAAEGRESFKVKVADGSGLVLRKRYLLDETGQEAEVLVNGKSEGRWNLRRSEQKLSGGVRESIFIIPADVLKGTPEAAIEVRYSGPANTLAWWVLEYREGAFPLSAVGAIHADQNFGHMRAARNITGSRLKIGTTEFANGLGVFAQSLLEFPIHKQFSRFTAKVGIDAVTEGRGSVVFEVYADGKKVWASGVMSGLDQPKTIDLNVKNVDRLRLIATDAGDGNKFDAANWCEPELHR